MKTLSIHSSIVLPTIVAASVLLTACEQEATIVETPLRSVRYVTVEESSADRVRTFTGVSQSAQEAKLSFKVGGTVTSLDVSVGDTIESGQIIATLDPSTYQLQLQQAQADLARAQAEQRNADAAYNRTKGLYETQSASRNELDTTRAGAESARAQVRATSRAVELASLNLGYTRLASKDDCSVASTSADVRENVNPGQEIVLVNCGDTLHIDVSVPENLIASMRQGMRGVVRFDSLDGQAFDGEVVEVGISATGTTFPVTITVANGDGLRSGLAAQVDFIFENGESLPSVPTVSVSEDQQGQYVYLLTDGAKPGEGIVKRQPVHVGELIASGIEITEGINPGDRVITAGVSIIRDGLIVKSQ